MVLQENIIFQLKSCFLLPVLEPAFAAEHPAPVPVCGVSHAPVRPVAELARRDAALDSTDPSSVCAQERGVIIAYPSFPVISN